MKTPVVLVAAALTVAILARPIRERGVFASDERLI
jgi:hypothetical protein